MSKRKKSKYTAKTADRHALYQKSVNGPEHEIGFLSKLFKRHSGRKALSLREDFCGTGLLATSWISSDAARTAVGLDIDREVLKWGLDQNVAPLRTKASRVQLREQNVLEKTKERFDVVVAFNYSYFLFKTRESLRSYFEAARAGVKDDGIFVVDLFGGWESQQVLVEERPLKHFTYVWDQAEYNPIDNHFLAHIHFKFPDGTKIKRAFTYDWRLWQLTEIRELLLEAGFVAVDAYWEGETDEGEGTGEFSRVTNARNDPGWNAYLVAKRSAPSEGSKDAKRVTKSRD